MKNLKPTKIICLALLLCFSFLTISCKKDNQVTSKEVTLNMWIEDKNNYEKLIGYFENKRCDEAEDLLVKFKGNQFKDQSYLPLARCFAYNKEKSLFYLTEAIKSGFHIKLIDSILFENVWAEIKSIYPDLNQKYWSQQDTTYFKEIEQLVYLDQKVRYDRPQGSNDFTAEIKQDSISSKWLIDYCQKNEYPKVFHPSHFRDFRKIDPSIMAVHAEDFYKREILDCAINAAQFEKISWSIPIFIISSFYVVRKPEGVINPLFMLYFDDEDNLDYEKSLLQLYSLQLQYGSYVPSKITLRPSLANTQDKSIIEKQLNQIKNVLVNDYMFNIDHINIDISPSEEKVYDDFIDTYLYTISAWRL